MMRSSEAMKADLQAAGLVFHEFEIHLEGNYKAADADWNYKDVPHLKFMHPGIQPVVGMIEDNKLITINLQKLFGLWLPMAVVNYHPSGQPQTYFTTWFFFVMIATTSYNQLEPLRCRVTTHYSIGGPRLLSWMFPLIQRVLRRNNKWLMEGDIPMRARRGELRAKGYGFAQRDKEAYTFSETLDVSRSNVTLPPDAAPAKPASIDLASHLAADGMYLFGDSGHLGLRLQREGKRLMVFPRMCPHEGACLDDRPCEGGRVRCEWHGRYFGPLAEFDLAASGPQRQAAGPYELALEGGVVKLEPRPDA